MRYCIPEYTYGMGGETQRDNNLYNSVLVLVSKTPLCPPAREGYQVLVMSLVGLEGNN